jgi:hypothetical protein
MILVLSSCASRGETPQASSSPSESGLSTPPPTVAPSTLPPRPKNWFDLAVGDCLTEIPAIDTGVVTTTVVDCATPHLAEVFLLAPLAVDTAIDEVALDRCATGFVDYTGRPADGDAFSVGYLIDSNQDRTANNPTPSTAICYLRSAGGEPLTGSTRR